MQQDTYWYVQGNQKSEQAILIIPIHGIILWQQSENFWVFSAQTVYGQTVAQHITNAIANNKIKGILLEIDSPWGTVYGTYMIVDAIKQYKQQTQFPVYAHVVGQAQWWAYWIASTTDKIFALLWTNIWGVGVSYAQKLSPEATATQKTNTKRNLEEVYDAFVDHVTSYRNIDKETLTQKHEDMSFAEARALDKKFIDEIGTRTDVLYDMVPETIAADYQLITNQPKKQTLAEYIQKNIFGTQRPRATNIQHTLSPLCETTTPLSYQGVLNCQ